MKINRTEVTLQTPFLFTCVFMIPVVMAQMLMAENLSSVLGSTLYVFLMVGVPFWLASQFSYGYLEQANKKGFIKSYSSTAALAFLFCYPATLVIHWEIQRSSETMARTEDWGPFFFILISIVPAMIVAALFAGLFASIQYDYYFGASVGRRRSNFGSLAVILVSIPLIFIGCEHLKRWQYSRMNIVTDPLTQSLIKVKSDSQALPAAGEPAVAKTSEIRCYYSRFDGGKELHPIFSDDPNASCDKLCNSRALSDHRKFYCYRPQDQVTAFGRFPRGGVLQKLKPRKFRK